jgi:hypothetical protein
MEIDEVDIFVITEEGQKYTLDVKKTISYVDLMEIIKKTIFETYFQVFFKGKMYTKDNENDILNFNRGDKIYMIFLCFLNK